MKTLKTSYESLSESFGKTPVNSGTGQQSEVCWGEESELVSNENVSAEDVRRRRREIPVKNGVRTRTRRID